MDVIPAIDVLDGRVVRLTRGRFDRRTVYGTEAGEVGRAWVEQGARLIHVVDLDGARSGRSPVALARELGEAGLPFQLGGGIRDLEAARQVISAGAVGVVVGTAAIERRAILADFLDAVGSAALVVALDVRGGKALGSGWRGSGRRVSDMVEAVVEQGVERVVVTGISRDGTMAGPDLDLLATVRRTAPRVRVIASGGVGSLEDIGAVGAAGAEAVVVGRALYEGRFTLQAAIEAAAGER